MKLSRNYSRRKPSQTIRQAAISNGARSLSLSVLELLPHAPCPGPKRHCEDEATVQKTLGTLARNCVILWGPAAPACGPTLPLPSALCPLPPACAFETSIGRASAPGGERRRSAQATENPPPLYSTLCLQLVLPCSCPPAPAPLLCITP